VQGANWHKFRVGWAEIVDCGASGRVERFTCGYCGFNEPLCEFRIRHCLNYLGLNPFVVFFLSLSPFLYPGIVRLRWGYKPLQKFLNLSISEHADSPSLNRIVNTLTDLEYPIQRRGVTNPRRCFSYLAQNWLNQGWRYFALRRRRPWTNASFHSLSFNSVRIPQSMRIEASVLFGTLYSVEHSLIHESKSRRYDLCGLKMGEFSNFSNRYKYVPWPDPICSLRIPGKSFPALHRTFCELSRYFFLTAIDF